jgi:hypothetical protein
MKRFNFNHIPKCGGTALSDYLKGSSSSSDLILINDIKDLIKKDFDYKKSIYGHMDHSFASHANDGRLLISLVREPKERIISTINHSLRDASFFGGSNDQLSADELIKDPHFLIVSKNIMTKLFCGNKSYLDLLSYKINYEQYQSEYVDDIDLALANIDLYDFIGVYEQFIQSVRVISEMIEIYPPKYLPKLNNQLPKNALSDIDEDLNVKLNEKDLILYKYVIQKFKSKSCNYSIPFLEEGSLTLDYLFFSLGSAFIGSGWYSYEAKNSPDYYGNKYCRWASAYQNLIVPPKKKYNWLILEIKTYKNFDLDSVKLKVGEKECLFKIIRTQIFQYILVDLQMFSDEDGLDIDIFCNDAKIADDSRVLSFLMINMILLNNSAKGTLINAIEQNPGNPPFFSKTI